MSTTMQRGEDSLVADGSTENQDYPPANGTPTADVVIVPNPEQATVEALPVAALSKSLITAHDRPASESLIRASSEKETKPNNRVSLSSQQYQPNESDRHEQHHHRRTRSNDERPMGHWPPRPEEPSPPIPVIDTQSQSALTESWNELSNQFEETVGKPSRDALHKFFYPPSNNNSNHHHSSSGHHRRNSSPRHSSCNHRRLASAKKHNNAYRDREKILKAKQSASQITDTEVNDAAVSENIDTTPETSLSYQPMADPPNSVIRHELSPEAPSTTDDGDGKDQLQSPESTQEHNRSKETAEIPPTATQEQIITEPLRQQSSNTIPQDPSGEWHQEPPQVPADFQQSFEDQEEQDRKYVERFWTIYDDIIMLSLFTQLGVVARLAASTWFTFFDGGVFRADSPLFTVLPLNCLSCFLLGLLGSGERLMEVIATRFTPRNLQQTIVREYQRNDNNHDDDANHDSNVAVYDDNDDDDDFENLEQGDLAPYRSGLRRRRKHRRPKRAKTTDTAYFKSWEPPIHWHDDLREVQLLALERRIRSSKCLILFPVNKEDADVMEHYVGEGYKASTQRENHQRQKNQFNPNKHSRRQRRRRFGRKKYSATNLADVDESLCQQGTFIGSGSFDDDEYDDDDDDDDEFGDDNNHDDNDVNSDASDNDKDDAPFDDGRFRFDLKLTESTDKSRRNVTINSADPHMAQAVENASTTEASPASMPTSIQKLIKRSPGMPSQPANPNRKLMNSHEDHTIAAAPASAQSDNPGSLPISPQSETVVLGITQYMHATLASPTDVTCSQAPADPEPSPPTALSSAQAGPVAPFFTDSSFAVQPTSRSSCVSDPDQTSLGTASGGEEGDPQLEQIISNVQANVSENISRIRRVNLAAGWDVGTTPEAMSDDLMLGLRDGFCGALSSFSSWNSSMLVLLREGQIGEAFIGYLLGLQLPIVAYRFGQHVAVYYFVWRCRREARREERKGGYGIRVKMDDDDDDCSSGRARLSTLSAVESADECFEDEHSREKSAETSFRDDVTSNETPSLRAICTALFLVALVTQFTSLSFFSDNQQLALSLLFSPVGTLARWRLSRLNKWRPGFPVGTFTCNILACALSGSLGSLLAGNPGPKERVLLQSVIAGFGGTLSSLATFIVEILSGMDPFLFRFDGVIYAICSIAWALIVGFVFSTSADWADETT